LELKDPLAKPVDGGWSEFGNCSKDYGPGIMKKTRTCSDPYPLLGGADWSGDPFAVESCNLQECRTDGCLGSGRKK
jgi:netrin receptor unc-5